MLSSRTKHFLHCVLLFAVIVVFEVCTGGIKLGNGKTEDFDPWERYGTFGTLVLYLLRLLAFLPLPQVIFNFIGLTVYNAFPDKVTLKGSPLLAPFLCIRIVTRGDYPQLVRTNVNRNMHTCIDAGLENFIIEVVTDKTIGLPKHPRIREVLVPSSYRPKSGALFKARALQFCLEDGVNILMDTDWIVHLDEETLLTENSVRGILNFVLDGKHQFGQGLITYANENVVNWVTTLADSFRVADDMGKLRLQFSMFHKPLFSMKGSYVVTQAEEDHVQADIESFKFLVSNQPETELSPLKYVLKTSIGYDGLKNISEKILSIPLSTASVERSFSTMNRIMTPLRNRLGNASLDHCMRISIEGQETLSDEFLVECLNLYASKRQRRLRLL